jgi:haloalkane dehalogenase
LLNFTIVAHDWGGPIGMAAALEVPNRLSGLVLFNTFAWSARGDAHFEIFSRLMGGTVGTQLVARFNLLINMMMTRMFSHSRLSAEAKRAYRGPFRTAVARKAISVFAREILNSSAFLASLEVRLISFSTLPTLIVWAERDVAFKPRHRKRLEAAFEQHTTVLLPDAGHFLQEECPEEIAGAIRDWMALRGLPAMAELPYDRHTPDASTWHTA